MPPLYSTITLIAEIVISAAIYYSIYSGYTHNKFPWKLAGAALAYEIFFNISYMVLRFSAHTGTHEPSAGLALAIIHGVLSLAMFIALIVFFVLAWINYRKGINYFRLHRVWTIIFLVFWTLAVVSGILFYLVEYVINV